MEIIDGALEEALHLRSVEVDRHDMFDTGDMKQIGEHASGDGAPVRLLLGLPTVREVWQDG